jgi:phenylacetate-CoA ligase
MRSVISDAFGVPVFDSFACTEDLMGKVAPDDDVFVFNTDMCIVELAATARWPPVFHQLGCLSPICTIWPSR